jgi:P pilus assembly chaperone PapD
MKHLIAAALIALIVMPATAKLLISPTRIVFDIYERSDEVILINTSTNPVTYRIEWKDMHTLPTGGYKQLEEGEALPSNSASELVRFSPRQVTLQPGERQVVKLLARRRPSFDLPEYRSHLNFIAIPTISSDSDATTDSISMRLDLFMSYSIPVLVKNAEIDAAVTINQAELILDAEKERYSLNIDFTRSGKQSFFGKVRVYEIVSGEKKLVGQLNGINLFTPIERYRRNISLIDYSVNSNNPLLIEMIGDEEHSTAVKATFQIFR